MRGVIPSFDYHGAHRPPAAAVPADRWEGDRCVAFTHDIISSPVLPVEFGECDVLVTDLPWANGFSVFNERAGISDGRTYAQFMDRVASLVESVAVPVYLVTGRHALPRLPVPNGVSPTRLNEDEAVIIAYRPGSEMRRCYGVAQDFLRELAIRYSVAGDFCCGYGRTARFFLRAGKRVVLSDYNPLCIGYVAGAVSSWIANG